MRAILGIDPGITGALAFYASQKEASSGLRWLVIDMPVIGGDKQELNVTSLRDFVVQMDPVHAFIERASAMPSGDRSMGVAGAFRYGGIYFAIRAVLACCGVPYTLVTAKQWKHSVGLRGTDKERSRQRALELFPELSKELARKRDHGRAEAALIASWGHDQITKTML